ncbi:MAG TPA: Gfo/Idh/MocA family oxidoreductase [Terriglobales bacterium]|nr:Gfo/Idh/MocA family oxidoreductase [Terriglobales bacterium]
MPSTLNVAVVGAGVFGRNHARVYHDLSLAGDLIRLAGIVDSDFARASAIAAEFQTRAFRTISELVAGTHVDAASVAVPTIHHCAVARELMQAGIDVLIEKPLATTLAEADELIRAAAAHGRIVQVGHLERFNPAVRATIPLLNRPMFFEVHRLSVFSPRALDVDVVLDLMIHDLDVVLSFVSSPIADIRAVGLPILSPKVDIANVRMDFQNGCVANFTASRVSTERVRKLRFFQPRQYISLDYSRQDVLVFTVDNSPKKPLPSAQQIRTGKLDLGELIETLAQHHGVAPIPDPTRPGTQAPSAAEQIANQKSTITNVSPLPGISMSKPPVASEEPLKAELRSFLDAVRRRTTPVVTLDDGRRALAAALQILDTIAAHARRANLS